MLIEVVWCVCPKAKAKAKAKAKSYPILSFRQNQQGRSYSTSSKPRRIG